LALFKFGSRDHIQQFVSEGLLYMNTLEYFARLEAESVRRDPNEGLTSILQPHGVRLGFKVNVGDPFRSLGPLAGPLLFHGGDCLATNVFCMFGLRASMASLLIDPRNFAFGEEFVLLREGDEFLRRAKQAALDSGQKMIYGMVEYVDETSYSGPMGPFRKYSSFSYQSEVRLAITPGTGAPYELRLGDLSDIVALRGPLSDINLRIKIMPESGPG